MFACDVCVYVCMCVCMYVRTHVRMYVCMYVCMYVYVCMRRDKWIDASLDDDLHHQCIVTGVALFHGTLVVAYLVFLLASARWRDMGRSEAGPHQPRRPS